MRNSRIDRCLVAVAVVAAAALLAAGAAHAALVAEWQFTANEDLDYGGTGGTDATLYGNASVNTDSTGLGGSWGSEVRSGYYVGDNTTGKGGDSATHVRSVGTYSSYFGFSDLTAGSSRMVVRSHFDGSA